MAYQIFFKPSAEKAFSKLSEQEKVRLNDSIDALADNPRPPGSIKMQGFKDTLRIRVGQYRVIYQIQDEILMVLVVRIGHRKEVYRSLPRLD
ncbi:MAG: type II toxin-antitoxin system RelE/ParE family toxin [Magnetococcales bacterium]|nr:type II toxin-antitoxin system RelE/ParE family toxin [Magnetococcales bacterium]